MTFPQTVTLFLTDPNPPGTVVDYAITRNGVPIGATTSLTFVDKVNSYGTYVYGGTPRSPNETTTEVMADPLVLAHKLEPLTRITVVVG